MMRRMAVINEGELRELLGRVCETSCLTAPVKRGAVSFDFERISDPDKIVFDYVRTVMPPKKAVMPPREQILEFDLKEKQASPVLANEPAVLFGIHPCDLKAINQLDWSMGNRHGVPDPHYLARRKALTIVGMECQPDEYCFCTSVDSCETRKGADLFLIPIEGGFLVEIYSEKGENLLQQAEKVREAMPQDQTAAQEFLAKKKQSASLEIEAKYSELPDLLEQNYESMVFEKTAERCYSCGTCTNVCPTCFCFDVDDEVALPLTMGTRWRKYDSCQFLDFAVVAGGHNFRKDRTDRVRHRWFRKFVYLLREHGTPFCVGCGRCSKQCTAEISLVDVMNSVLAEAKEGVAQ